MWLSVGELAARREPLKAIAIAERVLRENPDDVAAHRLLARAALGARLPQRALTSLRYLVHKGINSRWAQLEIAKTLVAEGDLSGAAAIYGRLLKDDPADSAALKGLRGIPRAKVAPAGPEAERQGKPSLEQEPSATLIDRYEKLLVHCPRNRMILKKLAEAYERDGKVEKAAERRQQLQAASALAAKGEAMV